MLEALDEVGLPCGLLLRFTEQGIDWAPVGNCSHGAAAGVALREEGWALQGEQRDEADRLAHTAAGVAEDDGASPPLCRSIQGMVDLGGELRSDFGLSGALRIAPAANLGLTTDRIDAALSAASYSHVWLGHSTRPYANHRPDGDAQLSLDMGAPGKPGLRLLARTALGSADLGFLEQPETWQPHGVPMFSRDWGTYGLGGDNDLFLALRLGFPAGTTLFLGGMGEADGSPSSSWAFSDVRLAGGARADVHWPLRERLTLLAHSQLAWYERQGPSSRFSVYRGGLAWRTYGDLGVAVGAMMHLGLLVGYSAQTAHRESLVLYGSKGAVDLGGAWAQVLSVTPDWSKAAGPGLLLALRARLGSAEERAWHAGYRRGALDMHSSDEVPLHYFHLGYDEGRLQRLDLASEVGLRLADRYYPPLCLRVAGELVFWPARRMGFNTRLEMELEPDAGAPVSWVALLGMRLAGDRAQGDGEEER